MCCVVVRIGLGGGWLPTVCSFKRVADAQTGLVSFVKVGGCHGDVSLWRCAPCPSVQPRKRGGQHSANTSEPQIFAGKWVFGGAYFLLLCGTSA
jgi:hypothetical protein